jgi:hypothetical protein
MVRMAGSEELLPSSSVTGLIIRIAPRGSPSCPGQVSIPSLACHCAEQALVAKSAISTGVGRMPGVALGVPMAACAVSVATNAVRVASAQPVARVGVADVGAIDGVGLGRASPATWIFTHKLPLAPGPMPKVVPSGVRSCQYPS